MDDSSGDKNLQREKENLKGSVDFVRMEFASNLQQFPDDSFDVVFSKELYFTSQLN